MPLERYGTGQLHDVLDRIGNGVSVRMVPDDEIDREAEQISGGEIAGSASSDREVKSVQSNVQGGEGKPPPPEGTGRADMKKR